MNESADWWGAINEQIRKYNGARNLPTKVADESDISESKITASVVAPSVIASSTPKFVSADIPKRPAIIPPSNGYTASKPVPLPARSPQPQPLQPSSKPISVSASSIPDYSVAEVSPETINISKLSLAEQMELKFQEKATKVPGSDIPQFDAIPIADIDKQPQVASNPWDTFESDNNPGW